MNQLTYNTPGLLFPAISLLMLAYTNRFFGLTSLVRQLLIKYQESKQELILDQINNLRLRISLVRYSQSFGIVSLILCILSLGSVSIQNTIAWTFFAISLLLMILSLLCSLYEIHLSAKALEIELKNVIKEDF
ncbi:PF11026 family protein [Leptospira broomii serovar Hurstbridge str. 5399]|uniref:PF11026 family protein n=1 Tax=Leptospira broomii serovar Hurstbridge str. 5399 TaxID=1049789 RepID=T0F742_9LEPT|nr:DUF2721 domain-containing protein [Leptospira broomii]EQA46950.1 PF11026 family protein [Leptospira broomii serovar Hurstbridge str. 5399]